VASGSLCIDANRSVFLKVFFSFLAASHSESGSVNTAAMFFFFLGIMSNVARVLLIAEIVLSSDMAKQTIIYVKCCADWFICLIVFFYLLRLFNFFLVHFFIYVVLPHTMVK